MVGHHDAIFLQKYVLISRAFGRLHSGMIVQRLDTFVPQKRRDIFGPAARAAIDDTAVAPMSGNKLHELAAAMASRAHGETQVGPVEAVDKDLGLLLGPLLGLLPEQPGQDVSPRRGVCGRRKRDDLQSAEFVLQGREIHVVGAEIVAPLRDAMGLVDRQQADIGAPQERNSFRLGEPLGRHIGKAQFAPRDLLHDGAVLVEIIGGVETRCGDAVAAKLRHLVAHQRDQRRHHDGEPAAHQRRQLIAQRLAAAGRHHGEHVAARENRLDDLGLAGAKLRKAEHGAQQLLGGGKIGHGGRLAVWVRLGKRALQSAQVLAQGRVQPLIHETPERLQIVCKRPALQRVEIRLAILGTNGNRRIAATDQHQVHQQTRGAPVAVAERMNRSEPKMPLERAFGR